MTCENCKYWERLTEDYDDPENKNFGYCEKHRSNSVRVMNCNFVAVETKDYLFLPNKNFGCIKFQQK